MSTDNFRMRMNRERQLRFERAMEILGTDTKSEVVDAALAHLVESAENYEDVKDEISPELADRLSTDELRIVMYPQVNTKR